MAFYDPSVGAHEEAKRKNYEELKESLTTRVVRNGKKVSKDQVKPFTNPKFWKTAKVVHHKHALALEHMIGMEKELEKQAAQIAEYKKFFATLQGFMPRMPSVHDIIG